MILFGRIPVRAAIIFISSALIWMFPAFSDEIPSIVTHPTAPGHYLNGGWRYEYKIWGNGLAHRTGILQFEDKQITRPMGSVLSTPLGRFMSFDNLSGSQVGYNTGWLMTAVIHNETISNRSFPVFLSDGKVNPEVLKLLPMKETDISEIDIEQITHRGTRTR